MNKFVTSTLTVIAMGIALSSAAEARPSWCSAADLDAETAICETRSVWVLDDVLNTAYKRARYDSPKQRNNIRQFQREWLDLRNGCGWNVACIRSRYKQQIQWLESFYND